MTRPKPIKTSCRGNRQAVRIVHSHFFFLSNKRYSKNNSEGKVSEMLNRRDIHEERGSTILERLFISLNVSSV